ncbi:mechanosensitive ion channel family protein [Bacteroides sp. OttesenSCG-928-D19]|nr:mechanosensitive ion channel family protein [Bacteroides sp. OttesenSCG-928-D19]
MMEQQIAGNSLENWAISLLIVLGTIVITRIVSFVNKRVIKPYTLKTKNKLDDVVYDSIESPILFAIMLVGIWIALHRLTYADNFVKIVDTSYRILIVLNITWLFARLCNSLIEVYFVNSGDGSNRSQKFSGRMLPVVKRTLLAIVWLVGIVTALSNIGVDISALLGTLGIGGIAFALAAQDTIKNIFGAFTILTDRPFIIGDTVKIDSYEGTIIDIGMRSTKMRNYDKRLITFPNYKIADSFIVNISAEPMRRVVMKIGLTYDTTPEDMKKAMDILRTMATRVKYVSPKDLVANFTEFADSALVITFIYYIEKKGNVAGVTSNVNMEILTEFNKEGLNFAFPTQTVYIEKGE